MTAPALYWKWDGAVMVPQQPVLARRDFVTGNVYRLSEEHERSSASHRHYFAAIHDAWFTIHEALAERFPTSEHLRKRALIECGFADERYVVCASKANALNIAAFVRPMDEFAIVVVKDLVVRVFTAKSQKVRAMGRDDFLASKVAVLDYCAKLIETTTETLNRNAGQAA